MLVARCQGSTGKRDIFTSGWTYPSKNLLFIRPIRLRAAFFEFSEVSIVPTALSLLLCRENDDRNRRCVVESIDYAIDRSSSRNSSYNSADIRLISQYVFKSK